MIEPLRKWVGRFRHAQLLVTLGLLILTAPFVGDVPFGELVFNGFLFVTLVSAVAACANTRLERAVGVAMVVAVTGLATYRNLTDSAAISAGSAGLGLLFFSYVSWLVLTDVFRAKRVSSDTICGALAVYLLLAVAWAFAYALLELLLPGSIDGIQVDGDTSFTAFLGYSFVTLTTLGYGNVVPANAKAEMIASAEAVAGQLYLTVLVARLVGMSLGSGSARDDEEG